MAAKNTKTAETVEVDESLADALGDAPEVDPLAAAVEQAQANIDRAVSLAEAENLEGLAELAKEHEELVSSMPSRGKIPTGDMTWAQFKQASRDDFRKASQAQPKPEATKAVTKAAKAEAAPADYAKFEGVKDRVNAAIGLITDGVKLHVKTSQTARQAAEMFLDAQRRIITAEGVPDLKCLSPEAIQARKDMYEGARTILAAESGDADHAKALVNKFRTAVQNQMSDVLVGYVRSLSESESGREEYETFYGEVKAAHPELDPADAVFTYFDIPRMSKRELMAENQRRKSEKLKELEAKAEDGDTKAVEAIEEIKAETVQEKIVGYVSRAETDIKAAIKAGKALSEDDRKALKAKIAELAMLAAEL
ncbi:hypothetical protein ACFVYV_09410 [Streptomyces mirabilis]|uniref:hypothetical protein n=1 Tax=Streptomyces mirabilis TaxID=68239 RepID=UPI0036DD294E